MSKSIYNITVKDTGGTDVPLSVYKGKVLLIVNTASKCGFTPQFAQLQELYEEFNHQDFEILAFPSNDFKNQEPLNGEAIQQFCKSNYSTTFPVFDKIHVKGNSVHPLFQFLSQKRYNGKLNSRPRWNFYKYLITREGKVADYFYSFTKPTAGRVKKAIAKLL